MILEKMRAARACAAAALEIVICLAASDNHISNAPFSQLQQVRRPEGVPIYEAA